MNKPLYGNQYRISKVCVDSYTDRVLEGRIYQYNSEFEDGICFRSTIEFLNYMEFIMKTTHFPDYQECRAFQKSGEMQIVQPSSESKKKGQMGTFVVKMLFRQHTSWQGTVLWCEKDKEVCFRSALELLRLMDSTMKENTTNEEMQIKKSDVMSDK